MDYEVEFFMDQDDDTGEWMERENNVLAGVPVEILDVDTRPMRQSPQQLSESGEKFVQVYKLRTRSAARLEQILDGSPDVLRYAEVEA